MWPVTSAAGADPTRDSLAARGSDPNALRVAGDAGNESGSDGRSGDPVTIESDPVAIVVDPTEPR